MRRCQRWRRSTRLFLLSQSLRVIATSSPSVNYLITLSIKPSCLGLNSRQSILWGTSRHCPRCGERGRTVNAPNDYTECRHGGYFHCPNCGYECDRDVVEGVNVGRKYLSDSKMEKASPAAYMEAGNHASVPSPSEGAVPLAFSPRLINRRWGAVVRPTSLSTVPGHSL